jgi:hypothetical protein
MKVIRVIAVSVAGAIAYEAGRLATRVAVEEAPAAWGWVRAREERLWARQGEYNDRYRRWSRAHPDKRKQADDD